MPAPWTQSISISWRPQLRFYERRISILGELDERKELRAFRVGDDGVDARIIDTENLHQISFRQDGLILHLLAPNTDPDRGWATVRLVVDAIDPTQIREMTAAFQYLAPLDMSFPAAIAKAREEILQPWRTDAFELRDFALLADLSLESRPAGGQIEFGIVRDFEIPARLSRRSGRTKHNAPPPPAPVAYEKQEFPAVALFGDLSLTERTSAEVDVLTDAWAFWDSTRAEADTLVDELQARLSRDDNGGDAK